MRSFPLLVLLAGPSLAAPPGLPGSDYPLHALTHARVYVTPERLVEDATLVVRQGRIVSVQPGAPAPPGARVWDCTGKVVHAGLVEPFLTTEELEGKGKPDEPSKSGEGDTVDDLRAGGAPVSAGSSQDPVLNAQHSLPATFPLSESRRDKLLKQGILTLQLVPARGIFRGKGSLYTVTEKGLELLQADTCHTVGLRTRYGSQEKDYPSSLMGNLAVIRQAFRDLSWSAQANAVLPRSLPDPSWTALRQPLPLYFEGRDLEEGRSLLHILSGHSPHPLVWVTNPDACLQPRWLSGRLVCTVDFPDLKIAEARRPEVTFAQAAGWRAAPSLPAQLSREGKPFVLSLHRLENWDDYPKRILQLQAEGLSRGQTLDALTRRPAHWLQVSDRLGTLEPGKWAHFVVRREDGPISQVWLEGKPLRLNQPAEPEKEPAPTKPRSGPAYTPEPAWPGPGSVLIRNATVWTQGPKGRLENTDVLIVRGKIQSIGAGLSAPAGILVVDGSGKHLLPGLIDAHSHTAILGNVNESTLTVTANVRIADVLRPRDRSILHQLAGGVTCAHVLHGSANAIGGQTVTCKWRWGADPEQLIFQEALPGIKFALGENPKQSNWGEGHRDRYPQTRHGVAALIRQRFLEARQYQKQTNPRPDAAMEALLEVLEGKRLLHCHCYRQDEILMILRLAEELGFRVATLQHGLEAYKVADEVARHGAGVSTFTDWWAYKLEVVDAIPYNGALLAQKGVVTSFNSDSDELARRLLQEAAKAVKYGGLDEQSALNFITLNPARQLRIEQRVGSLEVGKDGDCSLWSESPFAPQTRCLRTWVDGTQVFEESAYRQRLQEMQQLREQWLKAAQS